MRPDRNRGQLLLPYQTRVLICILLQELGSRIKLVHISPLRTNHSLISPICDVLAHLLVCHQHVDRPRG